MGRYYPKIMTLKLLFLDSCFAIGILPRKNKRLLIRSRGPSRGIAFFEKLRQSDPVPIEPPCQSNPVPIGPARFGYRTGDLHGDLLFQKNRQAEIHPPLSSPLHHTQKEE